MRDHTRSENRIVPIDGTQETVMNRSSATALLLAGALMAGSANAAPRAVTDPDAPRALDRKSVV